MVRRMDVRPIPRCIYSSRNSIEKRGSTVLCYCHSITLSNGPYSHKLLTINNYVNCPSNFAFARSIYLFHPPIFEKILMRIRSIYGEKILHLHPQDYTLNSIKYIGGEEHNGQSSTDYVCVCPPIPTVL